MRWKASMYSGLQSGYPAKSIAVAPMKMSRAASVSAHASANARKIVLRAGTYVTGISFVISSGARPLGTAMSSVRAEPPKVRRSNVRVSCRAAPNAAATRRAPAISASCRWP